MLFSATFANAAQAGDKYAGVQYTTLSYDESGFETLNPTALVGRFGGYVHDNFAIEARVGFGMSDDSLTVSGVDVALELDNLFGVYGVGQVPIGEKGSVYALIGYTTASITATATYLGSTASVSDDDNGLSFGIGAQFDVSDSASINAEYTNYLNGSNYDLGSISVGVNIGF